MLVRPLEIEGEWDREDMENKHNTEAETWELNEFHQKEYYETFSDSISIFSYFMLNQYNQPNVRLVLPCDWDNWIERMNERPPDKDMI